MPSAPYIFARLSRVRLLSPGKGIAETGLPWADANKTQEVPRAFGYVHGKGVISLSSKTPHGAESPVHKAVFPPRKEKVMGEDKQLQAPACSAPLGSRKEACEASARPGLLADPNAETEE